MKGIAVLLFPLMLAVQGARANTTTGNHALALAALVAGQSPMLTSQEKKTMARLFDEIAFSFPANRKIVIKADSIVCDAGDNDIAWHRCTLTFSSNKVSTLKGRAAHEIFATIAEVGVPEDGTAGRVFESLSNLECTIDPHEVQDKSGGGADCKFDPGQGARR